MAHLPKEYIVPFIAQLFQERKGEHAPPQLLASWQQLPDHEVDANLSQLFKNWGLTDVEKDLAIERFLQKVYYTPPRDIAPEVDNSLPEEPRISYDADEGKTRRSPIIWVLGIVILGILGFVGLKYAQYSSMSYVYAITENIAIRDASGKVVARMDLFAKDGLGVPSYSKLRAMDNDVHYMQYGDSSKEFPNRKIMMDTVGFIDYLFNKATIAHYVNTNYVVNDKAEFDLYQNVFNAVQKVSSDNNNLIALHRKVIVGSMAKNSTFKQNYIVPNVDGLSKSQIAKTESMLIQEISKNQHLVIITALDDGNYYRFEGDIKTNTFKAPERVYMVKDGDRTPLIGKYRFVKQANTWALYDVSSKVNTHYEIRNDADSKYAYFEYNAPEPLEDSISPGQVLDTILDFFN